MTPDLSSPDLARRLERAEQALRDRTFELTVLHELSSRIGASLTFEELFRAILTHLEQAIAFDVAAGLIATDPGADEIPLFLRSRRPLSTAARDDVEGRLLSACRRLAEVEIRREAICPIWVRDPHDEGPGPESGPPLGRLGSFFQVPILDRRSAVGVLLVGSEAPDQFGEGHLRLLYTVAGQAAGAVQRMRDHLGVERRRLQAIVEHLPGGVALLDDHRRVMLANPAGKRFLSELAGIGVGDALDHLGGIPFAELEARSPTDVVAEGPPRRVTAVTVVPLTNEAPGPWLVALEDATDARESVRRRDQFLAMLSHELRNPLAALSHATHLLQLPDADDHDRKEALAVIVRQVRHTARLVDDLLEVSRFLHGKIHLAKVPVDLAATVAEAASAQRLAFDHAGITLDLTLPDQPVPVVGDPARLTQVVDNLLSNARKFSPPGSRVVLSCRRESGAAVIRVRDQGPGIPPEKQAAIFEPFTQIEQTAQDSTASGLGLGLALVKLLVDLHGGTVTVTSKDPGHGAEFVVQLPMHNARQEATPRRPPTSTASPHTRRILVIEDQPDVREMFRRVLRRWGHEVVVATTGPEGIVAFRERPAEVVFVDIGLPGLDGFQVARAIRALPGGHGTRLVALTGHAMPEDRRRAREAGFDEHLAKPVDLRRLEDWLGDRGVPPAADSPPFAAETPDRA